MPISALQRGIARKQHLDGRQVRGGPLGYDEPPSKSWAGRLATHANSHTHSLNASAPFKQDPSSPFVSETSTTSSTMQAFTDVKRWCREVSAHLQAISGATPTSPRCAVPLWGDSCTRLGVFCV